jgi:hypothetical protein
MEPALRHPHQAAQMATGQAAAVVGNILKLHGFWAAKNIAAFLMLPTFAGKTVPRTVF